MSWSFLPIQSRLDGQPSMIEEKSSTLLKSLSVAYKIWSLVAYLCTCLYATGTVLPVAYRLYVTANSPTRGVHACTPRLRDLPVVYRPVRHGYKTHPWRTGLYASGVYRSSGVCPCTPLTCTPLNFYFCTPRLCFFKKKIIVILLVYCRWDIIVYITDIYI
jgi:hypothetical protein